MKDKFKFLVEYGLEKKIKNKWFLIINIILLVLSICLCNIDRIIKLFGGDFNKDTNILVIDNVGGFESFKMQFDDPKLIISTYDKSLDELSKEIEKDENKIGIILDKDEENIVNAKLVSQGYLDYILVEQINNAIYNAKVFLSIDAYQIDMEQINKLYEKPEIDRVILDKSKNKQDENSEMIMAYIFPSIILPVFMLVMILVQMIGSEINDEKTTKGMEIIISNVSAKTHFFSKIVVGNLFVLIQILLVVFYGAVGILTRGKAAIIEDSGLAEYVGNFKDYMSLGLTDKLIYVIPLLIILVILTFLAYSLMAGIFASITTNAEDFQQLQTPIIMFLMAGYMLSIFAAMFEGSILIRIFSYVPLISAIVAPSLFIIGQIGLIDMVISIALLVIFNHLLIKYGVKIYKVGILNYSSNKLYKKMWKAVKE